METDQITEMLWNKIYLEQPTVQLSGESRYMNPLWVSGYCQQPQEKPSQSDLSQSPTTCFELRTESSYNWEIMYKIRAALKILTFREQHVLVQFWSPRAVGKHQLLTTIDQPFGLGVASEELCYFRRDSEHKVFLIDKDFEEEDRSPPARVFRRGFPEWTPDITNYKTEDFPQQDCAIRCNLHGYLALPVFDSTTRLCVGVLEILTSFKYLCYAFEVQQVHKALKAENLTSPQVFDGPTKVLTERRQNELENIFDILKFICDIHSLPLAQTWTMSSPGSFVSHNKVIEKACSSFDTKCIGKVCMSTSALPFHVRDLSMWQFRKACIEKHLDKACGFVGKAWLDRGSCYCQDVTKLTEDEYPLVHYARMSGLTGCLTIFLHSVEGDDDEKGYVLEFFLQNTDSRNVLNLVQTLKQRVEVASGFELGEISHLEVIEPPRDVSYPSSSIKPYTIQISSTTTANTLMDSSDSDSFLANVAKTDSANVPIQRSPKQVHPDQKHCIITDIVNTQKMKQSRKRKIDSLSMEAVEQHVGKPLDQTAKILGVSRSTMKRFCREHGISSWPVPKHSKRSSPVTNLKLSQELRPEKHLQQSSIRVVVFVVLRVKRWSCSSKNHGFSGKWWSCGKHRYLPLKLGSIYQVARLVVGLRHWRRKSLNKRGYLTGNNVGHTGLLTVKASYKDDMIKFPFPVSSGLLELEKEVAKRLDVKGQRLSLKYKDEENDLVLVTCDADLEFMARKTIIRLLVDVGDDD